MYLGIFLVILTCVKLLLSRYFPLLGDEAYYSLWAQHLALSYVDHPPMIAYINWLINHTLGQNEFAVRLTAIAGILVDSGLVYLVGKEAFGKKVGTASAFLFNIIPTFLAGGLFLTPEQPLLIFWLASVYFCLKIVKTQQKRYWYLFGIVLGLGLLSKFTMLLFIPGLFLFLAISKENRRWLFRKEPYLMLTLAWLIFAPVIIWNYQHGFLSFFQHEARLGSPHYPENILYFCVLQFIMFSPPVFIYACKLFFFSIWKECQQWDNRTLLLVSLSAPAFLAFLLVSPFTQVGGHWTTIAYMGIIILLCRKIMEANLYPLKNWSIVGQLATIICINILFIGYYAFLYPIPKELDGKAYRLNAQLAEFIRAAKPTYVFSNQMGVASLVAFYGKTEVYLPKGQWRQFDIWGQPELKPGASILFFAFNDAAMQARLEQQFKTVVIDKNIRLFTKDSDIPLKTQVFICLKFL